MKLELARITNSKGNHVYYITKDGKMDTELVFNTFGEAHKAYNKITDEWVPGEIQVLLSTEL
jgi:hypothetical protein